MTSRFRVATTLARKLEELGVSPADVLRHAGLPPGLFDQEKILVSTEELFALYRGLGQASRDPAAHSFFRAFHDWEGIPPGEWRARHARAMTSLN